MSIDNEALKKIRVNILNNSFINHEGHIGSSFSILEILYVYYNFFHRSSNFFVLSKGHASIGLYSIFFFKKWISKKIFFDFGNKNSILGGHPDSNKLSNLVPFSTGSLGHGLPAAIGLAYSLQIKKRKSNVFILCGDQEMLEGTTWESLSLIQNLNLNNIVIILDKNNSDFRSIKINNIKKKIKSFDINVSNVNGHSINDLKKKFTKIINSNKSHFLICNTVKGKGIKLMENNPEWHHKYPTDQKQLKSLISLIY